MIKTTNYKKMHRKFLNKLHFFILKNYYIYRLRVNSTKVYKNW